MWLPEAAQGAQFRAAAAAALVDTWRVRCRFSVAWPLQSPLAPAVLECLEPAAIKAILETHQCFRPLRQQVVAAAAREAEQEAQEAQEAVLGRDQPKEAELLDKETTEEPGQTLIMSVPAAAEPRKSEKTVLPLGPKPAGEEETEPPRPSREPALFALVAVEALATQVSVRLRAATEAEVMVVCLQPRAPAAL